MTAVDLPLVRRWLEAPHVAQWWVDADEQFALVSGDFTNPDMRQFIVATADRPFAYLQTYDIAVWSEPGYGDRPPGTHAIDQFIGEPDMIGHGHGSAFIRVFVDGLLAQGRPCVLTDPDPANGRAVRAYEKAGFCKHGVVRTVEGPALLMVRNA